MALRISTGGLQMPAATRVYAVYRDIYFEVEYYRSPARSATPRLRDCASGHLCMYVRVAQVRVAGLD